MRDGLSDGVRLATRASRAAFVERLVEEGCDVDVLRFALMPAVDAPTFGANRNAMLLDQLDTRALCTDDDAIPHLFCPPTRQPSRRVGPGVCPLSYWPDDAAPEPEPESKSALAVAEAVLGRRCDEVHPELQIGNASRIAVATFGVWGDAGVGGPFFMLTQRGEARQRLVAQGRYRERSASRKVLRLAPGPTLSPGGFFMAGAAAYDGHEYLPPFFPFGRNEDGLFGTQLGVVASQRYIAHLPWAMQHAPLESRSFGARDRDYQTPRICDLLRPLVAACSHALSGEEPATRCAALGQRFVQLGRGPDEHLDQTLAWGWWTQVHRASSRLQALMHEHDGQPAAWADDIRRYVSTASAARRRSPTPRPTESEGGGTDATRQWIIEYGRMLAHWPSIVAAARRLRARGVRLSRPIDRRPPTRSGKVPASSRAS
ncbi:MAG: hypothetical protein AAF721_00060 [Myxococcota bacterium]